MLKKSHTSILIKSSFSSIQIKKKQAFSEFALICHLFGTLYLTDNDGHIADDGGCDGGAGGFVRKFWHL